MRVFVYVPFILSPLVHLGELIYNHQYTFHFLSLLFSCHEKCSPRLAVQSNWTCMYFRLYQRSHEFSPQRISSTSTIRWVEITRENKHQGTDKQWSGKARNPNILPPRCKHFVDPTMSGFCEFLGHIRTHLTSKKYYRCRTFRFVSSVLTTVLIGTDQDQCGRNSRHDHQTQRTEFYLHYDEITKNTRHVWFRARSPRLALYQSKSFFSDARFSCIHRLHFCFTFWRLSNWHSQKVR